MKAYILYAMLFYHAPKIQYPPIFHAPPTAFILQQPDKLDYYSNAYVYNAKLANIGEPYLSIKDIDCTVIDLTVNLNERNRFCLTTELLYLKVFNNWQINH